MADKPFRSINLPTPLVKEIESIIDSGKTTYNTKASFIEDAVRRRVEEIKNAELKILLKEYKAYIDKLSNK